MLLLEKKAYDMLSKITFAREFVRKIKLDNVLENYVKSFISWLDTLEERTRNARTSFAEFLRHTNFKEEKPLRNETQQRLLTDILREYEDIEECFYLGVDAFLPLISIWDYQRREPNIKRQHRLLVNFVNELLELSHISEPMMTIIGETYACLPLSWGEIMKHVVFGSYTEMENLCKWVLLAHEIGHAYYDMNAEKFSSDLFPLVIRKLIEVKPVNVKQHEIEAAIYMWTEKWIPELVADCFATKTLGPSFVTQFMLTVLDSRPQFPVLTHPPSDLRVRFMLNVLISLDLPNVDVNFYRNVWRSYCHSVSKPSSLYVLHDDIIKTALDGINFIVQESPVRGKWADVLKAQNALAQGEIPNQDLISIISALSLSEPKIDLRAMYDELLKRHSSDSDTL